MINMRAQPGGKEAQAIGASSVVERLGIDFDRVVIVTRDQVRFAKPDPDLFLTAAERLGVEIESGTCWRAAARGPCRS
jgi:beta-phosphoglucomutase-like phosphatase (HAD superfamily)